jgi:hypothetical protein
MAKAATTTETGDFDFASLVDLDAKGPKRGLLLFGTSLASLLGYGSERWV